MKNNTHLSSWPFFLLWGIFFVLFATGQFQRIEIGGFGALYVMDVVLGLIGISLVIARPSFFLSLWRVVQSRPWVEKILVAWIVLGIGVGIITGNFSSVGMLYLARTIFYGLCIFSWWYGINHKVFSAHFLQTGFLMSGSLMLLWGLIQYFFLPDVRFLFFLGWDDHYYRLISTLFDPGFTGIIFVLVYCLLERLEGRKSAFIVSCSWVKPALSLLLLIGILMTYSRATYLAFLTALGVSWMQDIFRKKIHSSWKTVVIGAVFLLAIPFLPRPGGEGVRLERTSTVTSRASALSATLGQLQGWEWAVGRGLFTPAFEENQVSNQYQVPNHARLADNWIVTFLQGTGVIGVVLFTGTLLQDWRRRWLKDTWGLAALAAVLVHGLFNATLFQPFVLLLLGGILVTGKATLQKKATR